MVENGGAADEARSLQAFARSYTDIAAIMGEETTDENELNMAELAMFPREWTGVFAAPTKRHPGTQAGGLGPKHVASGIGRRPLARPNGWPGLLLVRSPEVRRFIGRCGTKEKRKLLRENVLGLALCA